jgi:type II secretory pathway pseudopilin PulG
MMKLLYNPSAATKPGTSSLYESAATFSLSPSRNDAAEFRVERATGPFCRATSPTAVRTADSLNGEQYGAFDSAASCRRERAGGPFHPDPVESFRPRERFGVRGKNISQPTPIPVEEQSFLTTKAQAARRHAAFTVLEIMVAVALLAVIIVGLLAMFYQVQRAFRAGTAQVDVMENGRAAISMITREMHEATATGLHDVTNLVIVPARQGIQTSQVLSSGDVRDNFLQDLCFLQRRNDDWNGIAYRFTNAWTGVGTLVRYSWSWTNESNPFLNENTKSNLSLSVFRQPTGFDYGSQILDGVVHFQIEAYDAEGLLHRTYAPIDNGHVRFDHANQVYGFLSTNLPAYLDIELRVLEPATLARFRARAETDLTRATNYLAAQIGRTHVFRQRIPVRSAATIAF